MVCFENHIILQLNPGPTGRSKWVKRETWSPSAKNRGPRRWTRWIRCRHRGRVSHRRDTTWRTNWASSRRTMCNSGHWIVMNSQIPWNFGHFQISRQSWTSQAQPPWTATKLLWNSDGLGTGSGSKPAPWLSVISTLFVLSLFPFWEEAGVHKIRLGDQCLKEATQVARPAIPHHLYSQNPESCPKENRTPHGWCENSIKSKFSVKATRYIFRRWCHFLPSHSARWSSEIGTTTPQALESGLAPGIGRFKDQSQVTTASEILPICSKY